MSITPRKPVEPKKIHKMITLRVTEEQHLAIAKLALEMNQSINELCVDAIVNYKPDPAKAQPNRRIRGKRSEVANSPQAVQASA